MQCRVQAIAVVYTIEMLDFILFGPPVPGSDPDSLIRDNLLIGKILLIHSLIIQILGTIQRMSVKHDTQLFIWSQTLTMNGLIKSSWTLDPKPYYTARFFIQFYSSFCKWTPGGSTRPNAEPQGEDETAGQAELGVGTRSVQGYYALVFHKQ